MYHPDGIEVYLKPNCDDFATTKLREIPLEQDQNDPRHKRCVVYRSYATYTVVFRFLDNFDMGSASALSLGIGMGCDEWTRHGQRDRGIEYYILPRSKRDLGLYTRENYSLYGRAFTFETGIGKRCQRRVERYLDY